jgi:hypothetical protein
MVRFLPWALRSPGRDRVAVNLEFIFHKVEKRAQAPRLRLQRNVALTLSEGRNSLGKVLKRELRYQAIDSSKTRNAFEERFRCPCRKLNLTSS